MAASLTPDILIYGLATAGEPRISPDGRQIAYTIARTNRESKKSESQVWLCDVDGGNPRQLTWSGEHNSGARWSPDGVRLAFVSDRVERSGLFVMPLDGGEGHEVTRHGQPIGDLTWSPDGRRIAYTTLYDPDNPKEESRPKDAAPSVRVTRRLDYKQDTRGYLNDKRNQVFVVDTENGERRILTHEPRDHNHPQWSPDGRWLAARVTSPDSIGSQLGVIHAGTGEMRLVGPEEGVVATWAWSPDGKRIIVAGDTRLTYQTDFFVYDIESEEVNRLTDDLQVLPEAGFPSVIPPSQPVWLDGQRVLFHAVRAGSSGLYTVDAEDGTVEQLHDWQALNVGLSVDAARRHVVQAHASLECAGEIVVYDRERSTGSVITRINDGLLRQSPPATWEKLDVQRGEYAIDAWLLKPPGFDPNKRYPLILDVHGGPNGYYGYGFNPVQQCLATHEFLVVFANPRGSSSYGRHFTQQVLRDWGGEDYLDLMAVVDREVERPYVDADRTGIWGYSYGGYMTAWTIGQTQRFAAAVCGAPCFDLESLYGTSDIGHSFGAKQWSGPPHEEKEWYATHSPSNFAHRARTPTLIIHGEADERCPIGQGEQMFVALKKAGCEVEFVRYPGGSHLFLRVGPAEHREDAVTQVLGWFKAHLGEPAPSQTIAAGVS